MSSEQAAESSGGDYVESGGDGTAGITAPTANSRARSLTCCGVCDMRLATLFVNAVNIAMILLGAIFSGIRDNLFWKAIGNTLAYGLVGLVLSCIGLYGASKMELWAMYLASLGFIVALIMDAVLGQWIPGFFVTLIVLFPHVMLTMEIRNGVLTKENYKSREFVSDTGRGYVDRVHAYIAPYTSSPPPPATADPEAGETTPATTM